MADTKPEVVARRPIVIVESPFAGDTERNLAYARAAMRDCLLRGEAPFASHALYTQPGVLDDNAPHERALGIASGFEFRRLATKTVVYTDLGVTYGMNLGIADASNRGQSIEYRTLPTEAFAVFLFAPTTRSEPNPIVWKGREENGRCARLHADGTTVTAWDNPRSMDSMLRQLGAAYVELNGANILNRNAVKLQQETREQIESERDAARKEVSRLTERVTSDARDMGGLRQKASDLAQEVSTLRERVATLEAEQVASDESQRDTERALTAQRDTLEGCLEGAKEREESLRASLSTAEARVKELEAANASLRESVEMLRQDRAAIASQSTPTRHTAQAPAVGPLADGTAAWEIQRTEWSTHEPPPSPAKSLDDTLAAVHTEPRP